MYRNAGATRHSEICARSTLVHGAGQGHLGTSDQVRSIRLAFGQGVVKSKIDSGICPPYYQVNVVYSS